MGLEGNTGPRSARVGRSKEQQKKKTSPEAIDDGRLCRRAAEWRAVGRRLRTLFGLCLSGKTRRRLTPLLGAVACLEGDCFEQ